MIEKIKILEYFSSFRTFVSAMAVFFSSELLLVIVEIDPQMK